MYPRIFLSQSVFRVQIPVEVTIPNNYSLLNMFLFYPLDVLIIDFLGIEEGADTL